MQKAIACGLSAIAVTDHSTAEWIDRVKEAAAGTGLVVFPGVEISASGGIHVLAIFDRSKSAADVDYLLSRLGIPPSDRGKTDTLCSRSAHDIINEIVDAGALAILPHIDGVKGAFNTLFPRQDCPDLFNKAPYHAVETSEGALPSEYKQTRGFKRFTAAYQASDNPSEADPVKHSLDGLGKPCSFFKLDRNIDLEGIRQCFADPEVRIRRSDYLESQSFPRILQLTISDGFLKDQAIHFHSGLNSVIGGKGVGKSLIVEFMRFALGQVSADKDIARDHDKKLEKRLGLSGSVELLVRTASGTEYRIRRSPGSEPKCVDVLSEQEYEGRINDLFPILAYSQTEVIKMRFCQQVCKRSFQAAALFSFSTCSSTSFLTLTPSVNCTPR